VTFTPSAIAENPSAICDLVRKLDSHPLWECYASTIVLGAAITSIAGGQDPLLLLDLSVISPQVKAHKLTGHHFRNMFGYNELLHLIESYAISITNTPPISHGNHEKDDRLAAWICNEIQRLDASPRELVSSCLEAFSRHISKIPSNDLSVTMQDYVLRDILLMQRQPILMDNYRRFIVVKSKSEVAIRWDQSGVSFTHHL
jgi:hypothetical protein